MSILNRVGVKNVLALPILLLAGGCLTQGVKADKDKFTLIQPGVTSRALIEQSFGPPDAVDVVGGDHKVLIYSHIKASTGLLGILGSMDYDRQAYQFVLGKSDVVESCILREYHGSTAMFDGTAKETLVNPKPDASVTMMPATAP